MMKPTQAGRLVILLSDEGIRSDSTEWPAFLAKHTKLAIEIREGLSAAQSSVSCRAAASGSGLKSLETRIKNAAKESKVQAGQ